MSVADTAQEMKFKEALMLLGFATSGLGGLIEAIKKLDLDIEYAGVTFTPANMKLSMEEVFSRCCAFLDEHYKVEIK